MLVFDADLPGFGVRVTSTGKRIFLLQYRGPEGIRRKVIGEYGPLTPDKARGKAEELRGQVKGGGDPVAAQRAARQQAAADALAAKAASTADALTFRVLVERYQDLHLIRRREATRRTVVQTLLRTFAAWKDRPAHSITKTEAVAVLDALPPGAAWHAHSYARTMFKWAAGRDMLPANPFASVPAPPTSADRDRALSDAELREVWVAAGTLGWPFGPLMKVMILTLQRRNEVAGMRWREMNADLSVWTIPAERAKNGKAHVIYLPPAMRELLAGLPRIVPPPEVRRAKPLPLGAELVFTTNGETPVSGFSRAKARLDAAVTEARKKECMEPVELPTWWFHDFRRTGVTTLARLGVAPHVADRLLNHVQGTIKGVAAIYQRHDFMLERQRAAELWADHIAALVSGEDESATVLPFPGERRVATPG
jgi:integrase